MAEHTAEFYLINDENFKNESTPNSFSRPGSSRLVDDFENFDLASQSSVTNESTMSLQSSSTIQFNASKASPETLKWLMDNFEASEGVSLPRATLYALYMQHCSETSLEPINAASFGKMIRSIFSGLRTRRLGTRGNSKYHYYGIKLKQNSTLHKKLADICMQIKPLPGLTGNTEKRQRNGVQKHLMLIKDSKNQTFASNVESVFKRSRASYKPAMKVPQLSRTLLEARGDLEVFTKEELLQFFTLYVEHFEASISAINNNQFEYISAIWNAFWRHPSIDSANASHKIIDQRLPRQTLNLMCQKKSIINFVYEADNLFYQKFSEYIFPTILCGFDDVTIMNLKNATCDLHAYLRTATIHMGAGLIEAKQKALENFLVHTKDLSSMCHAIESVKVIFKSKSCLAQARADYAIVDSEAMRQRVKAFFDGKYFSKFDNIISPLFAESDQEALVQTPIEDLMKRIQQNVKEAARKVYDFEMQPENVNDTDHTNDLKLQIVKETKQVYVEWCLYSSVVLREMTIKGATSFGIFQLVRTLIDDYLMHCIKCNTARLFGRPLVCAMRDCDLDMQS